MKLKKSLIQNLEKAVSNFEFPFWENGLENAYTGIMKMTGIRGTNRLDLVFQTFEYSINENCIQTLIYHFSSEEITDFIVSVDWEITPHLDLSGLDYDKTNTLVFSTNKKISVDLHSITPEQKLYKSEVTPPSILFWVVDNTNPDNLFCNEKELCEILNLNNVSTVFNTYEWHHPDFNKVLVENMKEIIDYQDIYNAIELLVGNINNWNFGSEAKTNWRKTYLPS